MTLEPSTLVTVCGSQAAKGQNAESEQQKDDDQNKKTEDINNSSSQHIEYRNIFNFGRSYGAKISLLILS